MQANATMSCPRCGETMVVTYEGIRRNKQAKCPACGTTMSMPNDESFYRTQRSHKVKRGLFGSTTYEEFVENSEGNVPPPPVPTVPFRNYAIGSATYTPEPVVKPTSSRAAPLIAGVLILAIVAITLGLYLSSVGVRTIEVDKSQVFNAPADVNAVSYSPDGKYIVAVGNGSSLGIWDAKTFQPMTSKKNIAKTMMGMGADFTTVAFSPDSKHLAMAGGDEAVYWWNIETNTLEDTIDLGFGSVTTVHISADGSTMIACYGQFASFVDVGTWKLRKTVHWKGLSSGCAANPDHQLLAVGFTQKGINIYQLPNGELIRTLQDKNIDPQHILFSPNGKHLVALNYRSQIILWDAVFWQNSRSLRDPLRNSGSPSVFAFSPDSKFLAVGTTSDGIDIWAVSSDKIKIHVKDTQEASSVSFSPDNQRLVSGGGLSFANSNAGTIVRVWDIRQ